MKTDSRWNLADSLRPPAHRQKLRSWICGYVPSSGAELSAELSPSELPDAVALFTFFFVAFFFSEPFPCLTFFLPLVPPTVHWTGKGRSQSSSCIIFQQMWSDCDFDYVITQRPELYLVIAVRGLRVCRSCRFIGRFILLSCINPFPLRQRQELLKPSNDEKEHPVIQLMSSSCNNLIQKHDSNITKNICSKILLLLYLQEHKHKLFFVIWWQSPLILRHIWIPLSVKIPELLMMPAKAALIII